MTNIPPPKPTNGGPQTQIQGHAFLSRNRPLKITVIRLNFVWAAVLLIFVGLAAFFVGIASGTSGGYREFVHWMAGEPDPDSLMQRVMLAPDAGAWEAPLLGERLDGLSQQHANAIELYGQVADRYSLDANALLNFRQPIRAAAGQCQAAAQAGSDAAAASQQTQESVEQIVAILAAAVAACQTPASDNDAALIEDAEN